MEAGGMTALGHEVHQAGGATLREEAAVPPPPSPLESAALAAAKGIDATEKIFVNSCGQLGVMGCLDADRFNTWGYALFGQNRPKDALALFQLAAWAHPQSANAQDSLADGYMAVGDKESAKRSIERAIALAPNDPALDQAAKAQFVSEESTKLVKFK
jgi:tetratricopeptide (TPR) repeat protein